MKTVPEPTNKKEMNFLVIDGTRHWLNIYNLFYKKKLKWKNVSFRTITTIAWSYLCFLLAI